MLLQRVCLSVRPSVTLVYCIQTAEDIVKLLSRSGSPIILVFFEPERRYSISRRTPSAGVINTWAWEKFAIFDLNRRLSRKRYEIGIVSYYGTLIGSHGIKGPIHTLIYALKLLIGARNGRQIRHQPQGIIFTTGELQKNMYSPKKNLNLKLISNLRPQLSHNKTRKQLATVKPKMKIYFALVDPTSMNCCACICCSDVCIIVACK